MEMTDWQLVRMFAEDHSQAAFSELVRRYTNLVYRVCLRELGNASLTEEAAQAVFLLLAQKAPTLRPSRQETTLSSWLFQTALLTARNVRRAERRRSAREQKAAQMQADFSETPEGWADIEPLLNDALHALPPGQRTLILARYFEDRPLAEIGAGLGISEDAARMRVNRALDRLRRFFAARNVALSAAALAALLPHAVQPAPAHAAALLARLPLPTVGGSSAPTPAQTIAQGAIHTMNLNRLRLQLRAAALVAVFVLGTAGAVRVTSERKAQAVKAEQQQSQAQALAIMDRMYATYAAMKSFKCDTLTQETDNGGQVAFYEIERVNKSPLQRDKIRFERATLLDPELSGKALAICDSTTFYVTCTESRGLADRYAKFPAYRGSPSDFGALGSWGGTGMTGMPGIFFGDKLGRITNLSEPEYSLGQPTTIDFSGIACPVALDVVIAKMTYRAGTPGRDWPGAAETVTFYIGQKDHLLYQVIATDPVSPARLEISTQKIKGMQVNKHFNPADFVFTPPPGSHEVQNTNDLFPGGRG